MAATAGVTITETTATSITISVWQNYSSENEKVAIYDSEISIVSSLPDNYLYKYTDIPNSDSSSAVSRTFTGLSPSTQYWVAVQDNGTILIATATTLARDATPKVATQWQWEDLATRVKNAGKSTITMTNTDPGEGSTLAEGEYIGVYGDAGLVQTDDIAASAVTSAKIADKAVTSDKIDFTTINKATSSNIASATATFGFGTSFLVYHFGNIVFTNVELSNKTNWYATTGWASLTEIFPKGFRPHETVSLNLAPTEGTGVVGIKLNSDGTQYFNTQRADTMYFRLSAMWITADDWPS